MVEGVAGGEGGVAVFEEGEADEVAAGDGEGGLVVAVDADDAALAVEAGGDVEVVVDVEGHALGAAEALIEDGGVAVAVDGVDDLVGGGGGAGDEERAGVVEGEVVGGDAGLERGVDEDLAAGGRRRLPAAILKMVPERSPTKRLPSRSKAMPVAMPMPSA